MNKKVYTTPEIRSVPSTEILKLLGNATASVYDEGSGIDL